MSDLTDFLLARIAEDEALARDAGGDAWHVDDDNHLALPMVKMPNRSGLVRTPSRLYETAGSSDAQTNHIARHDPARVLAECEAKRRIVRWAQQWPLRRGRAGDGIDAEDALLRILAAVYADHPSFREDWRP